MSLRDTIKKITNTALLEYSENSAFISFKQLSIQKANASVKKLINAGYNAERIENYVKVTTR